MTDIAKALARPPMYPTKYFGCELGAQVKGDASTDRYIVNGAHDAEKLQTILDGFITKFVLCGSCKNPETDYIISKDETITKSCKACGANHAVDMTHKLVTYIIRNPPVPIKGKAKSKKSKKEAVMATPDTNSAESNEDIKANENDQESEGDDDELTKKIAQEAALLPDADGKDGDDDDWAVDTSADAVAARMKDLAVQGAVAKLMEDKDDDELVGKCFFSRQLIL